MKLIHYEKLIKNESSAFRYLLNFCWKNHQKFCPRCRHRKNYRLKDDRRRCARCAYTFHDFSHRWINGCDLTSRQWLRILKLFEMDLTILAMSRELDLAYNTLYKAVTTIRWAITADAIDARDFFSIGESWPHQQALGSATKTRGDFISAPVFGIIEHAGVAFVDRVPGVYPETVFHFHDHFGLRLGRWGKTYFSAPFQRYNALIFCSSLPPPRFMEFALAPPSPSSPAKRAFLNHVLERIRRYNGLSPQKFPLYLKELEFRYNNKDKDIFALTAELLCRFVPKFE